MFLNKVYDLNEVKLSPNMVLVEIITYKSNIILAGSDDSGNSSDIAYLRVFKSTSDDIVAGDIILETRGGANDLQNYSESKDGTKFFTMFAYDVKMWVESNNFNTTRKLSESL